MKFQLRETGWPLRGGRFFIPQGTIIDTDANADSWSRLVTSIGGLTPPVNSQPLDQTTYDRMRLEFSASRIITVTGTGGDGINRT